MYIERKTLNIEEDKWQLKYLEKLNFLTILSYCFHSLWYLDYNFLQKRWYLSILLTAWYICFKNHSSRMAVESPGMGSQGAAGLAGHRGMRTYLNQCRRESAQPESSQRIWLFYWGPWKVQLQTWSGWWTFGTFSWKKKKTLKIYCEMRNSCTLTTLAVTGSMVQPFLLFWRMAEVISTLDKMVL